MPAAHLRLACRPARQGDQLAHRRHRRQDQERLLHLQSQLRRPARLRASDQGEAETFVSAAMAWGAEKEAEAAEFYEFEHDVEVTRVGFLDHPTIAMSGASPDGLVGDAGLVEVKCPITATHIDTLLARRCPAIPHPDAVADGGDGPPVVRLRLLRPKASGCMRLFVRRVPRDAA